MKHDALILTRKIMLTKKVMRFGLQLSLLLAALFCLTRSSIAATYSLTASAASVQLGESVQVNWTVSGGGAKDWIAWFRVGDPNSAYDRSRWQYTGGSSSGSFTMAVPAAPGAYEFRYLPNDGFSDAARSQSVTVVTNVLLVASSVSVQSGQNIVVNWTAPTGSTKDWVSWFKVGDPNTGFDSSRWRYTNGASSGTFTTTAPTTAGAYEFRYMLNDGYTSVVSSQTITVSIATVSVPPTPPPASIPNYALALSAATVQAGQNISVNWTSPAGIAQDWISLYKTSDPNSAYDSARWRYTNGAGSGTFTTTAPTIPGNYEFRYLVGNGFNSATRSQSLTVTTATVTNPIPPTSTYSLTPSSLSAAVGQNISVNWTSPSGSSRDWIGWFKVGDANNVFDGNRWMYTNGASSGSFTVAPPTAGTFEFRYLLNSGYTDVARSSNVTVGSSSTGPTILLSANPNTISPGKSSKLSWSSTKATNCVASSGWSGNKALSGTEDVMPATTTTYALSCSGTGGTTAQNVTVSLASAGGTGGNYYIATTGNDSNPGTESAPFKTLQHAIPRLKPGETLFVRGGEYNTVNGLIDRGTIIPSGTSWNQPVTIKAYPGEKPVFRRYVDGTCCTSSPEHLVREGIHLATPAECKARAAVPYPCWGGGGSNMDGWLPWQATHGYVDGYVLQVFGPLKYVIFDGVDFDARGITGGLSLSCNQLCGSESGKPGQYDGPTHLRFQNLEIRNAIASCIAQPGAASEVQSDLQFINVKIHHCGVPFDTNYYADDPAQGLARLNPNARFYHPWYMHTGGNMLIDSEIYSTAGTGLSPDGDNNIITGNFIHGNASHGMLISGGKNWVVENNVFYNNGGIEIYHASEPGHKIRNNTIVAGPKIAAGLTAGYSIGIYAHRGAYGSVYENNIIDGFETGISNNGVYVSYGYSPNTTVRNNIIRTSVAGKEVATGKGSCPECAVAPIMSNNFLNLDPMFVNKAAADFRLKAGSPAIGRATDGGDIGARD